MPLVSRATVRHIEHSTLGALLAGALVSPVIMSLLGWSEPPPIPLPFVVLLSIAAVGASLKLRHRNRYAMASFVLRVSGIVVAAGSIAFILQRGTNAFYTSLSLLEGTVALLTLHVGSRVMRWTAVVNRDDYLVVPLNARRAPLSRLLSRFFLATGPLDSRRRVTIPAVALADGLASVSAWSLLAFWTLVTLEHRHVASLFLLFVSVLLVLECIILIPDTLAGWGLLPRAFDPAEDMAGDGSSRRDFPPPEGYPMTTLAAPGNAAHE